MVAQESERIAVRVETQGKNSIKKCTNTNGIYSLHTLVGSKQLRRLAEIVDRERAGTHVAAMDEKE